MLKKFFSNTIRHHLLTTYYVFDILTATFANPHNQQGGHYYSLFTEGEIGSELLLSQGPRAV